MSLSPRVAWLILASYLILIILSMILPIKNINLIVYTILMIENLSVIGLHVKGKYFS
ncbi:hypothetical protein ACVR0S_01855 [Streptococcus dentapri]|uniref:Uncharacterized protein n=1 Tax=Streptococcus dentapri TaxID=573564 RepID=A0ABV8D300_9STRE